MRTGTILATSVALIGEKRAPGCVRCGVRLNKPRSKESYCRDCIDVRFLEGAIARTGVNVDDLSEDEFIRFTESAAFRKTVARRVSRGLHPVPGREAA